MKELHKFLKVFIFVKLGACFKVSVLTSSTKRYATI